MPWNPVDPAWQYELLDRLAPGVDPAQLEEASSGCSISSTSWRKCRGRVATDFR